MEIVVAIFALFFLGALFEHYRDLKNKAAQYDKLKPQLDNLQKYEKELAHKSQKIDEKEVASEKKHKERLYAISKIVEEKTIGSPWLASLFAEYIKLEGQFLANLLEKKKRPSLKGSEQVKEVSKKRAEAERKYRIYKYLVDYYENIFPWIVEAREYSDEDLKLLLENKKKEDDFGETEVEYLSSRNLLSPQEYKSLSPSERYQRALDRYWSKEKAKWEIGRDYERYVGYIYEKQGYKIEYFGINEGLADLGRDIIAKKDSEIKIIQCKYWSQDRVIHEKHIFQLFGTLIEYKISVLRDSSFLNPKKKDLFSTIEASAVFYTSTKLSDKAREFAKILQIEVVENSKLEKYPCIKCNISKQGKEKIYHLPFDQQYDKIVIESNKGEFYASTIMEAEEKQFRKAFKWQGDGS